LRRRGWEISRKNLGGSLDDGVFSKIGEVFVAFGGLFKRVRRLRIRTLGEKRHLFEEGGEDLSYLEGGVALDLGVRTNGATLNLVYDFVMDFLMVDSFFTYSYNSPQNSLPSVSPFERCKKLLANFFLEMC